MNQAAQDKREGEENPNNFGQNRTEQQGDQNNEIVEDALVKHMEPMFEIENLKRNTYLLGHISPNLELQPHIMYNERLGTKKCTILQLNAALQKCKNIEYKTGSMIKLKIKSERKTLYIKGVKKDDEKAFRELIDELCAGDEKAKEYKFEHNPKLESVSLTFATEATALKIFSELINKKFQDKPVDCIIKDENLYMDLQELLQRRRQGGGYNKFGGGFYPQQQMMMTPFGFNPQYQMYPMPQQFPMYRPHQNYIRKNKDNYRGNYNNNNNYYDKTNNNNNSNQNSPSTDTSYDTRGTASTNQTTDNESQTQTQRFKPRYNNYNNNDQEGNGNERGSPQQQQSGYQKGGYPYKKRYNDGTNGDNRGGDDRRGGYKGNGQGQQKRKPKATTQEIEKITSVDEVNYPPLN